jgi:hypothetical protein
MPEVLSPNSAIPVALSPSADPNLTGSRPITMLILDTPDVTSLSTNERLLLIDSVS